MTDASSTAPVQPSTLREVLARIERLWPASGAEKWDSPGLVTGDPEQRIRRVLLVVDVVDDTVTEAIEGGFDLVVAHHPLLLRGITTVAEDTYKGRVIARLIRAGIALTSVHTNGDVVENGVSDVLAQRLGLVSARPVTPTVTDAIGIGRVGTLPAPTTLGRLARAIAELLPATAGGVRVAGEYERPIATVSLCGGAGDSLLGEPAVVGSDVFITADLRHHPASEARERALLGAGPALIDVSHWASEWLWLETAAGQLRDAGPGLEAVVSETRTDPWDFVVVQ